MLTSIADGIWTLDAPLSMFGLEIGTRMSVVRLPSGDLLVHSPIALDDEQRRELDALGTVRHVVAPNAFHHLFVGDLMAAYPDARLCAPKKLRTKRRDLAIDADLDASCAWEGVIDAIPIEGTMLHETALVHTPTGTVLAPDLLENFETSSHRMTRWYLKAFGVHGRAGVSLPLRLFYRDRRAARRGLDQLLEHDIERIVVAHGEVLSTDAKSTLRDVYTWL